MKSQMNCVRYSASLKYIALEQCSGTTNMEPRDYLQTLLDKWELWWRRIQSTWTCSIIPSCLTLIPAYLFRWKKCAHPSLISAYLMWIHRPSSTKDLTSTSCCNKQIEATWTNQCMSVQINMYWIFPSIFTPSTIGTNRLRLLSIFLECRSSLQQKWLQITYILHCLNCPCTVVFTSVVFCSDIVTFFYN